MASQIETEEREQVAEIVAEIRAELGASYWRAENADTRRGAELERARAAKTAEGEL